MEGRAISAAGLAGTVAVSPAGPIMWRAGRKGRAKGKGRAKEASAAVAAIAAGLAGAVAVSPVGEPIMLSVLSSANLVR